MTKQNSFASFSILKKKRWRRVGHRFTAQTQAAGPDNLNDWWVDMTTAGGCFITSTWTNSMRWVTVFSCRVFELLRWKFKSLRQKRSASNASLTQFCQDSLHSIPSNSKAAARKVGRHPPKKINYSESSTSPQLTLYIWFCFWTTGTPTWSLTCKASKKRKEPRRLPRGTRQNVELYSISL